jgi:transcriptional regulator GlxA family with amidase domain
MSHLSLQDIALDSERHARKRIRPKASCDMDRRVLNVIKLMEVYFDQPLSLDDLARSVNLSPWRLSHIFKTETRTPPLQYLRTLRMRHAKRLLETTFLSVKQIMTEIGVRDGSHFVRNFKITYGLSPTRYRQRFLSVLQRKIVGEEAWQQVRLRNSKFGQ